MKRIVQGIGLLVLAFLMLGSRGCVTTDTVVVPEGPVATQLGAEKDKQIAGLVAQVKAEHEARKLIEQQASLAAANLVGVEFAVEHVAAGLPRDAIEKEARLGKDRLPPPDPTELLKAKDRVIAILNGEVEKAKALYGAASNEAAEAKAQITAKDTEIAKRDGEIKKREGEIISLTKAAEEERAKHVKDVENLVSNHKAEVQKLKDDYANKQQQLWILGIRAIGLFFILAGGIAIVVFKRIPEGALGMGLGLIIGVVSVGFDKLVSAPWFPIAFGILILIAVGIGGYFIYRLWRKHRLHEKLTAAIQDLRDEDAVKGTTVFNEVVEPHLKYRLGGKDSSWGREQVASTVELGLVDPKGEETLKAPPKS